MERNYTTFTYFDGVAFEEFGDGCIVLERVKDPIPEMRESLTERPNGHGSYLDSLTMSPRTITLECRYFGERWQDFDDLMDALSEWLVTDDDRPMSLRTDPDQHYLAHFKSYEEGDREGGTGIGAFTLTFVASDPIRYGASFARVIDSNGSSTFDVGGTDSADLTLTLTVPSWGGTYGVSFWNSSQGRSTIRIDTSAVSSQLSSGNKTIGVDCVNHSVKLMGTMEYGVTLASDWPDIVPGRWKVTTTNCKADLSFVTRYR